MATEPICDIFALDEPLQPCGVLLAFFVRHLQRLVKGFGCRVDVTRRYHQGAWLQLLPYQVETTYGWRTRYTVEVNSYYRPIFASEGGDVALGQLAVQCLAVVVATVLAVFVLGGLPKQGDRLRNAQ